ncbi:hypothetical protein H112_08749 [Trichophyton rubrum D6]|uniref:Uncharacterized protein n=1 Tax=Trichophyton rubrum CBS 288.86 TaxID=1215330 RepID=A0A022VNF5_TRIRU|nr:hypothetical protein H100_08771 [Trichophyton rubrum MR850]EZF36878.1 hypothetical protein H102_08730 [Trichophyton rubrum CBS 100081]EZF47474.1 hypothetical protein H103_08753 [Trichophyton rubrum CBS 288.86]EZF58131.1 hypothetical protein H104_08704 [Trichophyton rubrum CBS 289.86]EZF79432.1 hypothetical protein H110_08755 [Trichophyton rubrum MR1448]EZG11590.1 hypothetical protein H107_08910 [Trichophyton rubrum CBS 202.88]KDB28589.1 hypothetical protein H112_08749 [Trichophyton rubrum 
MEIVYTYIMAREIWCFLFLFLFYQTFLYLMPTFKVAWRLVSSASQLANAFCFAFFFFFSFPLLSSFTCTFLLFLIPLYCTLLFLKDPYLPVLSRLSMILSNV